MKKILTILYLGISLLSIAQQNNENLLKHTPTETVAYDYFLEQILHKEYPKMKHFVFYEKIKTEKIFNYSVCNPIDNSKMIFSATFLNLVPIVSSSFSKIESILLKLNGGLIIF